MHPIGGPFSIEAASSERITWLRYDAAALRHCWRLLYELGSLPRLARNWLSAFLPAPTWKRDLLPLTFMTEAAITLARSMRWTCSRRYRRPRVRG